MSVRLGLFGGSFDPIHCGHLIVARAVAEQLSLERIIFLPSARPPHKEGERLADPAYQGKPERAIVFDIAAWDVNCPQHITPRFDEDEVAERLAPLHSRIAELEAEVASLRAKKPASGLRLTSSWIGDSRKLMQIRAVPDTA